MSFEMFDLNEIKLMFSEPLDLVIPHLNIILLKTKVLKIIFF